VFPGPGVGGHEEQIDRAVQLVFDGLNGLLGHVLLEPDGAGAKRTVCFPHNANPHPGQGNQRSDQNDSGEFDREFHGV
jgi:hypothetical protein